MIALLWGAGLGFCLWAISFVLGFTRDRSFYPVVLAVIASYYVLFAVMAGNVMGIWVELAAACAFIGLAFMGLRFGAYVAASAIALHGVFDAAHAGLIGETGAPLWWPTFCGSLDIVFAALAILATMQHSKGAAK